jgi:soluble lytic murein transglycosylase-like protein
VDSESPIKTSGVAVVRWIFIATITCFMIFFPVQLIHVEAKPEPKEAKSNPSEPKHSYLLVKPIKPNKKGHLFYPIIHAVADKYRVDSALVKAIIMAESGYNPRAISKRGAKGLMQLMPRTAASLGVKDSFNPEENITGGVKYLKKLLKKFGGNLRLAVAAYNAGVRKVRKYNGIPPFKATRYYVEKVLGYYHYYRIEMERKGNKV